uniref:Uncharacterized protein n=1 Tax=Staphylothermus marinus TaxID=2280 RepID=A0A7J3KGA2_STAMA
MVNVVAHGTVLNETWLYRFYVKATGLTGHLDIVNTLHPITVLGYKYFENNVDSFTGVNYYEYKVKDYCEYVRNLKVSMY